MPQYQQNRFRPKLNVTLSAATLERLKALSLPFDGNISRTIEALVRAAPLPRPTAQEKDVSR